MYGYGYRYVNGLVIGAGAPVDTTFKMTVDTTKAGSASDTFVLPISPGVVNFTVDWGDGNSDLITVSNQAELTHVYASSGSYQIALDGSFTAVVFGNTGDRRKLSSIDNWGTNQWSTFEYCFYGCSNMVANYTDTPDTSICTSFSRQFRACTNFNGAVDFDASMVTVMETMFYQCTNFNQPINFNCPLLVDATYMFAVCSNFNSTVNLSTSSSLALTTRMFQQCTIFNSSITISDTSGVTDMSVMFYNCINFDQDISAFQINALTSASFMLQGSAFSQTNYDLLLPAWDAYGTSSVVFHAGTAHYSAGAPTTAHNAMVSRGWTITDGGTP
tara:strand:+ start:51 stop:1040 length:990 start_codon:yes stop_codon:yes gene_type:complete